jgi:hypothetical protein
MEQAIEHLPTVLLLPAHTSLRRDMKAATAGKSEAEDGRRPSGASLP